MKPPTWVAPEQDYGKFQQQQQQQGVYHDQLFTLFSALPREEPGGGGGGEGEGGAGVLADFTALCRGGAGIINVF